MVHWTCGFPLTSFLDLDYMGDGFVSLFSSAWVHTQPSLESDGPFSSDSTRTACAFRYEFWRYTSWGLTHHLPALHQAPIVASTSYIMGNRPWALDNGIPIFQDGEKASFDYYFHSGVPLNISHSAWSRREVSFEFEGKPISKDDARNILLNTFRSTPTDEESGRVALRALQTARVRVHPSLLLKRAVLSVPAPHGGASPSQ